MIQEYISDNPKSNPPKNFADELEYAYKSIQQVEIGISTWNILSKVCKKIISIANMYTHSSHRILINESRCLAVEVLLRCATLGSYFYRNLFGDEDQPRDSLKGFSEAAAARDEKKRDYLVRSGIEKGLLLPRSELEQLLQFYVTQCLHVSVDDCIVVEAFYSVG